VNVNDGTSNFVSGLKADHTYGHCNAARPELTARACLATEVLTNSRSNLRVAGPVVSHSTRAPPARRPVPHLR